MKKIIEKYYLSSFYIITFIFAIPLLMLHFIFQSVGKYSVSFTQLSPAFAVVFISIILKDRTDLRYIKSRLHFDLSIVKWVIPVIAIPGICIAVSGFIMSYYKISYIPWQGNPLFYILNTTAILAGCAAEEIGWRGFLLPNFQKKYSPFISSIIVGVLWGIWHLNFTGGTLGFILYTITIIEMSILMTWVFNKTNGNLLLMIVWHFIFNLASHILLWERFNISLFIVESIVFGILCTVILVLTRYENNNKKCMKE
jgi:CAAX amino terminal protease family.